MVQEFPRTCTLNAATYSSHHLKFCHWKEKPPSNKQRRTWYCCLGHIILGAALSWSLQIRRPFFAALESQQQTRLFAHDLTLQCILRWPLIDKTSSTTEYTREPLVTILLTRMLCITFIRPRLECHHAHNTWDNWTQWFNHSSYIRQHNRPTSFNKSIVQPSRFILHALEKKLNVVVTSLKICTLF